MCDGYGFIFHSTLIFHKNAPNMLPKNFHALTRLDENRAKCQVLLLVLSKWTCMALLSDNILYIILLSDFCYNSFGISLFSLVVLVFILICQLKSLVYKVCLLVFL